MAVETLSATLRAAQAQGTRQVKESYGGPVCMEAVVEVSPAASVASVYTMMRVPLGARIHGASVASFDDLASVGSPTIDFGLAAVDANFTTDDDCLNDGVLVTAAGTAPVIKDRVNYGKQAWEFIPSLTIDPGGFADVIVTIRDAATDTGGTLVVSLWYSTAI